MNLVRVEPELRHRWVARGNAFRQGLPEGFDRVAQVQGPEGWCDLQRALRHLVDRMASRTIVQGEGLAALLCGRSGHRGAHHEKSKSNSKQMNLHFKPSPQLIQSLSHGH